MRDMTVDLPELTYVPQTLSFGSRGITMETYGDYTVPHIKIAASERIEAGLIDPEHGAGHP